MSDLSSLYKVAVIRSRNDNCMTLCEVPKAGYVESGDVVLFGTGECVPEEGVCVYPSTWIDDISLALIEAATGRGRPFPAVYGRMVMERFVLPEQGE